MLDGEGEKCRCVGWGGTSLLYRKQMGLLVLVRVQDYTGWWTTTTTNEVIVV